MSKWFGILFVVLVGISGIALTGAASSEVVIGHHDFTAPRVDFWIVTLSEPSELQIDVLAYECAGSPTVCEDFFGNGVGNDLIDTVVWLGDGLAADPTNHPFVSNLIDVTDDCFPPCDADGSVAGLDSYVEAMLSPGQYVVAVEGIGPETGHYQLTFTAPDTDTLSVSRERGLPQRVQGEFLIGGSRVEFWHFSVDETTTVQIDALAYECSGFPEVCTDFFGNGVGNDLVDTVIWLGDGLAADPTNHPFVSNLIDVTDDCFPPCDADGSVAGLDSYVEATLSPGHYVVAVEGLYGETAGNYQLTFTALDTDTLAISRPNGLQVDLGTFFGSPSGSFAAAAGQRGSWNEVGLVSDPLVDSNSWPSAASVSVTALSDEGWDFSPSDDAELLLFDNIYSASGNPWQVEFSALAHGDYFLYLYAPGNPSVGTGDMTVNGEAVEGIPGGGSSGALVSGVSWTAVEVTIDDGTLTVAGSGSSFSGLAGLQIVPEPSTPLALGSGLLLLGLFHRGRLLRGRVAL